MKTSRAYRYAAFIDRFRWPIMVGALVLTAVSGWLASHLPLHGDFAYLLPQDAPSVVSLHELEKRVKNLGTVMVAVESDDPALRSAAAQDLRDRLEEIQDGLVAEVSFDDGAARQFVWQNRWLYVDLKDLRAAHDALADEIRDAKLKANPLYIDFEDKPAAGATTADSQTKKLREKLDEAERNKDSVGFVSKDGKLQLIVVRTTFEAGAASKGVQLIDSVSRAAAETQKTYHVTIGITGDVVSGLAEHDALVNGMMLAALLTSLIVALGLVLYYRSVRAVGALLFALVVGTAATFGYTYLAIGYLNVASAFLSSIVFGNGINFGILVVARHLEERRRGQTGVDALAGALGGTLTGTLAAALTAAVAYGSLVSTNFKGFKHFGVIGGVGMIICWVMAYTVLPAGLAILERRGLKVHRDPALGRLLANLMPRSNRGAAIVASVALLVTGLAGVATWKYLQNPYEDNFRNLRSSSADIERARDWLGRIDDAFGRNISGGFIIATPTREAATHAVAQLKAVDAGKPPEEQLLGGVKSIDDVLPSGSGGEARAPRRSAADDRHRVQEPVRVGARRRRKAPSAGPPAPARRRRPARADGVAVHREGRHARAPHPRRCRAALRHLARPQPPRVHRARRGARSRPRRDPRRRELRLRRRHPVDGGRRAASRRSSRSSARSSSS